MVTFTLWLQWSADCSVLVAPEDKEVGKHGMDTAPTLRGHIDFTSDPEIGESVSGRHSGTELCLCSLCVIIILN